MPFGYSEDDGDGLPITRRVADVGEGVIDLAAMRAELEAGRGKKPGA